MRREMQMIFQDPYESLNPRMQVADVVAEPLRVHHVASSPADERARVVRALTQAGLTPAEVYLHRYPFQLSGGQRQRVVAASALALEPRVLIADEPVSMLDVSIRAEILNLLRSLATSQRIAVVMITHDLSTVAAYADRIAVMYLGRIVEIGTRSASWPIPSIPIPAPSCRLSRRPTPRHDVAPRSSPARPRIRPASHPAVASTRAARSPSNAAALTTQR